MYLFELKRDFEYKLFSERVLVEELWAGKYKLRFETNKAQMKTCHKNEQICQSFGEKNTC